MQIIEAWEGNITGLGEIGHAVNEYFGRGTGVKRVANQSAAMKMSSRTVTGASLGWTLIFDAGPHRSGVGVDFQYESFRIHGPFVLISRFLQFRLPILSTTVELKELTFVVGAAHPSQMVLAGPNSYATARRQLMDEASHPLAEPLVSALVVLGKYSDTGVS